MNGEDERRTDAEGFDRADRDREQRFRRTLERERVLQRVTQGLARDRTAREMAETVLDGVDIFGATTIFVDRWTRQAPGWNCSRAADCRMR